MSARPATRGPGQGRGRQQPEQHMLRAPASHQLGQDQPQQSWNFGILGDLGPWEGQASACCVGGGRDKLPVLLAGAEPGGTGLWTPQGALQGHVSVHGSGQGKARGCLQGFPSGLRRLLHRLHKEVPVWGCPGAAQPLWPGKAAHLEPLSGAAVSGHARLGPLTPAPARRLLCL